MSHKTRILICDDEPHIIHVVGLNLRSAGYEVIAAGHGQQALDLVAEKLPSLCIIDHNMPAMNGAELCRELRAVPGLSTVPVIMLTAVDYRLTEFDDPRTSPTTVMGKPFSPRVLLKQVESLLNPPVSAEAI